MALKIRLQRHGSTHNPVYRVVVAESSARRDGKFVETIGMRRLLAQRRRAAFGYRQGSHQAGEGGSRQRVIG